MTTWVLDPELLILEVESRPILYVKSLPEYANRPLKNDAWEEIARKLSYDWESLVNGEKIKRCKEVQTKWKHIRDNFRREYQAQRDVTSGQGAKKRKKYRYYDQLLFLIPYVKDAPTSGNYTAASNDSEQSEPENTENVLSAPPAPPLIQKRKKEKTTFEEEVLKSLRRDMAEPDEDTSFCLSLVQSLKKMDDDNKMAVKIGILTLIRQYSRSNIQTSQSQQSLDNQSYLGQSIPSHGQPQQFSQVAQPSSISMNQPHFARPLKSVHPSKEINILEQYQYCPPTASTNSGTTIGNSSRPQSAQSYFSQYVPVPSPSPTDTSTSSSTIILSPLTNVTASSPEEYQPSDTYSHY